jgi:long-chain acyl-CoA synthetase
VDIETGETTLKAGEFGELVVKGPQVMKGYWERPDETFSVFRDGWLYTGDIYKMEEDGYFFIINRKKELIKYKGHSVYQRELEEILYEHPAVKLCSVIGKPDPTACMIPKAYIVLNE